MSFRKNFSFFDDQEPKQTTAATTVPEQPRQIPQEELEIGHAWDELPAVLGKLPFHLILSNLDLFSLVRLSQANTTYHTAIQAYYKEAPPLEILKKIEDLGVVVASFDDRHSFAMDDWTANNRANLLRFCNQIYYSLYFSNHFLDNLPADHFKFLMLKLLRPENIHAPLAPFRLIMRGVHPDDCSISIERYATLTDLLLHSGKFAKFAQYTCRKMSDSDPHQQLLLKLLLSALPNYIARHIIPEGLSLNDENSKQAIDIIEKAAFIFQIIDRFDFNNNQQINRLPDLDDIADPGEDFDDFVDDFLDDNDDDIIEPIILVTMSNCMTELDRIPDVNIHKIMLAFVDSVSEIDIKDKTPPQIIENIFEALTKCLLANNVDPMKLQSAKDSRLFKNAISKMVSAAEQPQTQPSPRISK